MNFGFDEEQRSLGETVARQLADLPDLRTPEPAVGTGDAAWQSLAELGLFALLVPEQYGGANLTLVDLALAIEALGFGLAPTIAVETLLATDLLVRFGSVLQRETWLPRIATGDLRVAVAMVEAGSDYDFETFHAAVADARLSGCKLLVSDAERTDLYLVVAQTGSGPGIYLVPAETAGISVRAHEAIDPSSNLCAVRFEQVSVPTDALLLPAMPRRAADWLIGSGATLLALLHAGIAARMLETSVEFAKTRVQFGQAIGSFQAIKHRCADMAVAVEAVRSATYYAIWALSNDAPDRSRAASMAKAYAGEIDREVCNNAIQIHGGMGFTWELGLHRYLRRGKVLEHAFGSAAWHYERVIQETLAALKVEAGAPRQAA